MTLVDLVNSVSRSCFTIIYTYYFSRIFDELFDLQVRLMAIENQQHDLVSINATKVDGGFLKADPKDGSPNETLYVSWLIML